MSTTPSPQTLRYSNATDPGFRRRRSGRGFTYLDANGRAIKDPIVRRRISTLVIPPAWEDVWICADDTGHLQATGRDAKGRTQCIYHELWTTYRAQTKYDRLIEFAEALPAIHRAVERDSRRRGMDKAKVVALVVHLLECSAIRVGNERYVAENKSFGLTTMRTKHVEVTGQTVRFRFKGKSGQMHDIKVQDRRVARAIRLIQDLPGQELLQFVNDAGEPEPIRSQDVNEYLHAIAGKDFSSKDFRTWRGTVEVALYLHGAEPAESKTQAKRTFNEAVKHAAKVLGNRPATCRRSYVHPALEALYMNDHQLRLGVSAQKITEFRARPFRPVNESIRRAVLSLLRKYDRRQQRARAQAPVVKIVQEQASHRERVVAKVRVVASAAVC